MRHVLNDKNKVCKFLMDKYQYWESIDLLREPYDCYSVFYLLNNENADNIIIPRSIVRELEQEGALSRECLEAIANVDNILEGKEAKRIYESKGLIEPEEAEDEIDIR